MALVTKLKEYRERDDLKQAELAELVGVPGNHCQP